jgi:hypothetical protein
MKQLEKVKKVIESLGGEFVGVKMIGPRKTRATFDCVVRGKSINIDPMTPYTQQSIAEQIERAVSRAA